MPHVTIETQYDPKSLTYCLAVYRGASFSPDYMLGEPLWTDQGYAESEIYSAKFKLRDQLVERGDIVHFAPICRVLGVSGRLDAPTENARDSFLIHGEGLLKCLKAELDDLSSEDLCSVAKIVFAGVETRIERDVALDEERFVLEAIPGSTMLDYARYRLNGGHTEKPKAASAPKM